MLVVAKSWQSVGDQVVIGAMRQGSQYVPVLRGSVGINCTGAMLAVLWADLGFVGEVRDADVPHRPGACGDPRDEAAAEALVAARGQEPEGRDGPGQEAVVRVREVAGQLEGPAQATGRVVVDPRGELLGAL